MESAFALLMEVITDLTLSLASAVAGSVIPVAWPGLTTRRVHRTQQGFSLARQLGQ